MAKVFEWYFGFFVPFKWYFKLPLRVPLSPTEMSLNGPMVLNDTEWYSVALFYKDVCVCVCVCVRACVRACVRVSYESKSN